MAAQQVRSPAPRRRLTVAQASTSRAEGAARRWRRSAAAASSTSRRGSGARTARSCWRTRRRGDQGRGARRRPAAPVVGLRCSDRRRTSDGALFNFLAASKRSVVVDPGQAGDLASLDALLGGGGRRRVVTRLAAGRHPELAPAEIRRAPSAPRRHLDHPVRARGTMVRQAGDRVHPPGLVRRGRRPRPRAARPGAGVRGRPDRRVAAGVYAAIGTLAAGWRGEPDGELVDVSMLETLAMCLTYYPVTFNDQLGRPDATPPLHPDAGRRRSQRRAGRAGRRDRAAVARLLRHGRPSRVGGGSVALPGPHRPGTDDRRRGSARTASTRCSTWPRPSASPTPRSPTAPTSRRSTTSARAARSPPTRPTARRTLARPSGSAAGSPPATRAGPSAWAALRWTTSCGAARARAIQPAMASRSPVRGPAGPRHDGVLGGATGQPHARAARSGGDPRRIVDAAGRRPTGRRGTADGGSVLGAGPIFARSTPTRRA